MCAEYLHYNFGIIIGQYTGQNKLLLLLLYFGFTSSLNILGHVGTVI